MSQVIGNDPKVDGVVGIAHAQSRSGVLGISNGAFGAGVTGTSSISHGVHGVNGNGASNHPTVGTGLYGETEFGFGVYGASVANDAIHGESTNGVGVFASGAGGGVIGQSTGGPGVHGKTSSNKDSAVFAEHTGQGIGVFATGGTTGVFGQATSGPGVHGKTSSDKDSAVFAEHTGKGVAVFGVSANGFAGFFQGNTHTTGSHTVDVDILLKGADCAEHFDVSSLTESEPGTVMVVNDDGRLEPSRRAYDKRVVGVVSGAGDFKPGIVLDKRQAQSNRMPIALLGKVYCKVDARHAAVDVGDLLSASPTPGHAMKAADPLQAFGSVIGKALRPLKAGKGLIPILIALQ
ncbi:MAG: hypothetical protein WB586_18355 [Chthoniobacterales bacterium]